LFSESVQFLPIGGKTRNTLFCAGIISLGRGKFLAGDRAPSGSVTGKLGGYAA